MAQKYFSNKLNRLLKPPCDLTMYDNEKYINNPLLNFRLQEVKEQRHTNYLKLKAAAEKIKIARKPIVYLEPIRLQNEEYHSNRLRMHGRKMTVPRMATSTENKIKSLIPKNLISKYPEAIETIMKEVHSDCNRRMKIIGIKRILKHPEVKDADEHPEKFDLPTPDLQYKFPEPGPGPAPQYNEVLVKNRKKLANNVKKKVNFLKTDSKPSKKGSSSLERRSSIAAK